jgi:hypothetical protein
VIGQPLLTGQQLAGRLALLLVLSGVGRGASPPFTHLGGHPSSR